MNIGDTVRFLNDIGGGKVSAFRPGGIILVEDEDGFDVPVREDEVVVIETNNLNIKKVSTPKTEYGSTPLGTDNSISGKQYLQSKGAAPQEDEIDENLEARIVRLEMTIRKLEARIARLEDTKSMREKEKAIARQARKQDKNTIIEVDLHAHEILETTAGMSAGDIKEYQLKIFRDTLNSNIHNKGKKIVFIHGKGEGALRKALIDELKYAYKSCEYQDASFQQYGFGATMVIIH